MARWPIAHRIEDRNFPPRYERRSARTCERSCQASLDLRGLLRSQSCGVAMNSAIIQDDHGRSWRVCVCVCVCVCVVEVEDGGGVTDSAICGPP